MQCSRLNLSERARVVRRNVVQLDRPRRYCQKRLVNPEHDEDPRWCEAALERFRCENIEEPVDSWEEGAQQEVDERGEELFLSVLNLKFQGNIQQWKRPRSCFKYKSANGNDKHRMFIKQIVDSDNGYLEESRLSVDPNFYFDDYIKYIINRTEQSRPSTGKSSLYFRRDAQYKGKENKAVQVDTDQSVGHISKQSNENESTKRSQKKTGVDKIDPKVYSENNIDDTKITYHNIGKRKSLTISRAQSPETVQVIRVDVVCNHSSSASTISTYEGKLADSKAENVNIKNTNFANKYLLTNTVKSLDENVCGGSKVTLLCKTFRLAARTQQECKQSTIFKKDEKAKKKEISKTKSR